MALRQKALWTFIALLLATSVAQGYYLHYAAAAATPPDAWSQDDGWRRQQDWLEKARKRLLEDQSKAFKLPDSLFDDELFKPGFDPFKEIEQLERRMSEQLQTPREPLLDQPWDGWFTQRMNLPAIVSKTKKTDKEVVVELTIPGLDKDSLNIKVDDSRIRVTYDAKTVQKKQDGSGREVFQSESESRFEQVLPVPDDADGRSSRIAREGDVVKIIFPRREHAIKADA